MANGLVFAADYPGSDIGAKINAADADLGAAAGVIVAYPGDYTLVTPIVLSAKRKLAFSDGTITPTHDGNSPSITIQDDCTVMGIGSHWSTKILEPLQGTSLFSCVIADASSGLAGGPNDSDGYSRMHVENIQFVGIEGNTNHQSGTVAFANSHDVSVIDCFYNATSTYGCIAGGSPANGFYANGVRFERNKFDHVGTQNIAVVNAANVFVNSNLMRRGGITAVSGCAYIDVELNTGPDVLTRFQVCDNIVDAEGGCELNPSAAIQVTGEISGTDVVRNGRWGVIGRNIITMGQGGGGTNYGVQGIHAQMLSGILVVDNVVKFGLQGGIALHTCDNATVARNTVIDCGSEHFSITVGGSRGCKVHDNDCITEHATNSIPGITETGDEYLGQTSDSNLFYNNRVQYFPRSDTTVPESAPGRDCAVILTGPNSREFQNTMNDTVFGVAGILTVDELRAAPIPGTRDSSAPPNCLVLGLSASGDSQPAMFVYDFASTRADNGFSVIKPHLATTFSLDGAWIKAPLRPAMDSTARDALAAGLTADDANRVQIFNTTTGHPQEWDGAAWQNIY